MLAFGVPTAVHCVPDSLLVFGFCALVVPRDKLRALLQAWERSDKLSGRALWQGTHGGLDAGASEPRNLAYMERLGLWGVGNSAFTSFNDFLHAIGSKGVGGLELVAMDMKARGVYVCRTLSFDGPSYACQWPRPHGRKRLA